MRGGRNITEDSFSFYSMVFCVCVWGGVNLQHFQDIGCNGIPFTTLRVEQHLLNYVVPAPKTPLAVCFRAGTSWEQQGSERTHSVVTQVVTTITHCGLHKKIPWQELFLWKFNVKFSSKISVGNGYLLGTQLATLRGLSSGAVPHSAHLACRRQGHNLDTNKVQISTGPGLRAVYLFPFPSFSLWDSVQDPVNQIVYACFLIK